MPADEDLTAGTVLRWHETDGWGVLVAPLPAGEGPPAYTSSLIIEFEE